MHVFIDLLAEKASWELEGQLVDTQTGIMVELKEINEFYDKTDRVLCLNLIPFVFSFFQEFFVSVFNKVSPIILLFRLRDTLFGFEPSEICPEFVIQSIILLAGQFLIRWYEVFPLRASDIIFTFGDFFISKSELHGHVVIKY